jgi:hypothetical protein
MMFAKLVHPVEKASPKQQAAPKRVEKVVGRKKPVVNRPPVKHDVKSVVRSEKQPKNTSERPQQSNQRRRKSPEDSMVALANNQS